MSLTSFNRTETKQNRRSLTQCTISKIVTVSHLQRNIHALRQRSDGILIDGTQSTTHMKPGRYFIAFIETSLLDCTLSVVWSKHSSRGISLGTSIKWYAVECAVHMLNHMTIYRALMTAVSVSVRKFSHLAAAIKVVSSTDSIMC